MADFLDETFGAQASPVNIDDMVEGTPLPTITLPQSAIRNRAATTAMLSDDPAKAVDSYQMMVAEADKGDSTLLSSIQQNITNQSQQMDMKGVMSVLSDPKLPIEEKRKAIAGIQQSQFLKDTTNNLYTRSLEAPSKGETIENEDARLSSVDAIREIYQVRQDIQGLVNAHAAQLPDASLSTVGDMAAVWVMPFGNNISTGKVASNLESQSVWKTIKQFALAGSTTADLRNRLASVPPEKRVEFAQSLLSTIQNNSGIILSSDNHFAQYDKATQIFGEGGYSGFEEFVDNVSPLLDVIGVGQAFRGIGKASKVAKVAEEIPVTLNAAAMGAQASRTTSKAPPVVQKGDLATVTGKPTTGAYDAKIEGLQSEKADLLGASSPKLEPTQVQGLIDERAAIRRPDDRNALAKNLQAQEGITSKAAKEKADKIVADQTVDYNARVKRIDDQINGNAQASTVSQRIDAIDKQIKQLEKNNTEIFIKKNYFADMVQRMELESAVKRENPASPAAVIGSANPQQARNLHEVVVNSVGDEVAEGLYGTSKVQAITNDVYPQVTNKSGAVRSKVGDIDGNLRQKLQIPEELIGMLSNTGASYYTAAEKAQARANVVNRFSAAEGLTVNDAMSSFRLDGGQIKIGAVYGADGGSFLRAEDAMEQAERALRNMGVAQDEVQLLQKQGLDHVPVNLEDVRGVDGDYLIRVETSHEIDPTDISNFDKLDVKRNFFDRIGPLVTKDTGSASRWMFDAASMLHPTLTGAASVASDATAKFDKLMLRMAADYSDSLKGIPKQRVKAINDYIREANYNGIKFDTADLVARGFDAKEIEALTNWRKFWDGHFYLENYDLVRSLNSQGYQLFKNNNAELYARPISKNQNIGKIYDPASDTVITHSKAEGDALYNSGGTYAKLRRPTDFGGTSTEYMIVRNTPNENLRKLRDSDQVLNYRDGYFQIQYKAPRFVEQAQRDASGALTGYKAIAVAGDTKEAEQFAKRMASSQGLAPEEFRVRGDDRALARDSDAYWDVNGASGRIAQRHRGKLLEDGSGLNHLGDGSYILNPVDSAIRAARSISGRTVNRPMLEAAKARFISQYAEMLPTNGMGGRVWPKNVKEITRKGLDTSSEVADARTSYEYINYLENGYINNMDTVFKTGFNAIADMAGNVGLSKIERGALNVSEASISGMAKHGVFLSYIASNVFRQWIVQPHQMLRTMAYNPTGFLTQAIPRLGAEWVGHMTGLTKETPFAKFVNESGLLDAVDKSNLVRGTLLEAANTTNVALRMANKPMELMRKAGFDLGEQANLLGHTASVYDLYKRKGLDLTDKVVRDKAYSEIRAISYDMNFAGDMVYNQTTPAVLLQFLQVPHKAMLQMTNRRIPPAVRARMVAADMVMWGTPALFVGSLLGTDVLPDDPKAREVITYGLESMLLNHMFNELIDEPGENTNIDFSSLAPYEMTGWAKFFTALNEGGLHNLLVNSPAGQLFGKDGGRTTNAIKSLGRYFGIVEDDDEEPEEFLDVMNEVMKISSGWSNAVKAKILLDGRKRYDQYGSTIDQNVTYTEAWAQALGFSTGDTRELYRISMDVSKGTKAHKEETLKVYNDIKRYYAEKLNVENSDPKFITKVSGRVMKVFESDPVAQGIIVQQMKFDLMGKDQGLLQTIMKRSDIPDVGNLRDQIRMMPIDDGQKQKLLQRVDDMEKLRKDVKKD